MDVEDVAISSVRKNNYSDTLTVYGSNFTKNTKIFVNGSKVSTKYLTPTMISTDIANVKDGDIITVNILGSKSILLRAGVGEVIYVDPDVVHETETTETETTETETTEVGNTETETTETENTESSEIETQSSEAESSETESSETTTPIITRLK